MRPLFETVTPGTRISAGVLVLILTLIVTIGLVPLSWMFILGAGLDHTHTIERILALGLVILTAAIPFVGTCLAVRLFRKPKNMGSVTDKADGRKT